MRRKKTGGRDFEKGNQAAVGHGRPIVPPEIKRIKKYTAQELEELITALFTMSKAEVYSFLGRSDGPAIKHAVASVLSNAIENGSGAQLESLLNRIIGKVKDTVKHEGLKPSILELTDGKQFVFGVTGGEDE